VTTHHPWFTVDGGAKTYVDKILAAVRPVRLPAKVVSVTESADSASVVIENGESMTFDRVIIAAHADEALAMLSAPTSEQSRLLGAFGYQRNMARLHTDECVMPRQRRAWAAWNYRVADTGNGPVATTHYWMNALQNVSKKRNYFVSINGDVPADQALYEAVYEHPVFTLEAMRAQTELPTLNTRSPNQRTFFCGSYFRHGFHEDAYASAVDLSSVMRPLLAR
jgi:predicted NAD/FAD-binding protein